MPPSGAHLTCCLVTCLTLQFAPAIASQSDTDKSAASPPAVSVEQKSVQPAQTNLSRPRIGLALGGGGARGAAHVGVLKVLEEEHIPIDYIAGTSMGSVIGGLYAAGIPLAKIERMLEDRSLLRAYNRMPFTLRVGMVPLTTVPRLVGIHHHIGLYSGNKFAKFLAKEFPANRQNVENTVIPFSPVTTNLLTGKPYVVSKGSLAKALQASTAVPLFKKPVAIDGKELCDGFLSGANLPVQQVRDLGADIIICVDVDGPPKEVPDSVLHHFRSFRHRVTNILVSEMDEDAAKQADVLLRPEVSDIGMLIYNESNLKKAMTEGERTARSMVPQIRRLAGLESNKDTASTPVNVQSTF